MNINGTSSSDVRRMFGLGSGLDIDDMVSKLMDVERLPLDRLLQRRQVIEWQKEDYRSINLRLKELDDAALSLRLTSTFNTRKVTSSNDSVVSVTASAGAPIGAYTIRVTALAESAQFHSKALPTGTKLGDQFGITEPVTFTIKRTDAAGNVAEQTFTFTPEQSMTTVANAISNSNLGMQAFYDANTGRLFVSGKESGSAVKYQFTSDPNDFLRGQLGLRESSVPDPDPDTEDTGAVAIGAEYTGKDAIFDLNGAVGLKQHNNDFTINGVTYSLRKADPSAPVTIQVRQDTDAAVSAIKSFVDKYNDIIGAINDKLAEKRNYDFAPLTDAQKKEMKDKDIEEWEKKARSGLLRSDPLLTQVVSEVRRALTESVEGTGSKYDMLSAIGIESKSWQDKGKLTVDETKLRQALETDMQGVVALFTQDGDTRETKGIGNRLNEALDAGMKRLGDRAGSTNAVVDNSPLGKAVAEINRQITVMEDRLKRREEYYYKQFSAMESFMSQINTQSAWLTQQFMASGS